MKTSLFAVAVSAASLLSAVAQVQICTCTGDCKARGDPHVEQFDGINIRLEQVSDVDTWNMLYEVANAQVEILISEQNQGIYATEVKIRDLATGEEIHELSNEYCQLGGNNQPIRATVNVVDNPSPVSEQSVDVEVRCAKPKDTRSRCPNGSRDLCDWHFDTFVTKSSEVRTELGGEDFDFQRIEDLVNSDGYCLPPDEWSTDNPKHSCICETVDDPPLFEPTSAPVTWAPTTPSPTTAAPTTQTPTLAPTRAPTTLTPTGAPTTLAPTLAPTTIAPTMPPTGNLTCRLPAADEPTPTSCFSGTLDIIPALPNNLTLYQMDDRFLVVGELEPNTTGVHVKTLGIQFNGKWITRIDSNDWCKPYSLRGLQDTPLPSTNSTSAHAQYVWPESQEYVMVDVSCTFPSNANPSMSVVINKKSSSPQAIQNPNQWEQDQGYSGICVSCLT